MLAPRIQVIKVSATGVERSRSVNTGSQTCPDDVTAACYTIAGTFSFEHVKKGNWIGVCVINPKNHATNCDGYKKGGSSKLTVHISALQ